MNELRLDPLIIIDPDHPPDYAGVTAQLAKHVAGIDPSAVMAAIAEEYIADLSVKTPSGPFVEQPEPIAMQPADFSALADLVSSIERPPRYEMHVAVGIIESIRVAFPPPAGQPIYFGGAGLLGATPLVPDEDLAPGCWELYADGELVNSGRLGEEK